jgi:hypothetical protein
LFVSLEPSHVTPEAASGAIKRVSSTGGRGRRQQFFFFCGTHYFTGCGAQNFAQFVMCCLALPPFHSNTNTQYPLLKLLPSSPPPHLEEHMAGYLVIARRKLCLTIVIKVLQREVVFGI